MRTSPSLLALLTAILGAGLLVTWTQVEAIISWEPTVAMHLGMALAAAGSLVVLLLQLVRPTRTSA